MDVEKLISEIFVRPELWNQAHPDHHNRHVLTKLWNEVTQALDSNRTAVQKKWKYLRAYFREECGKKRSQKSGSSGECGTFSSTWPHFKSMTFLLDQIENRASSSNFPLSSDSSSSTPVVITERQDETFEDFEHDSCGDEPVQVEGSNVEPRCDINNRKRKRPTELIGKSLLLLEKEKLEYLKSKNTHLSDEDSSFFQSLLPHVKRIPNDKKLLFRNEVQAIVQHFAYSETLDNNPPSVSIPSYRDSVEHEVQQCFVQNEIFPSSDAVESL